MSIREEAQKGIRDLQAEARDEFAAATGLNLNAVTRALEGQLKREREKKRKYIEASLKKAKAGKH
jgi:hypothetical protein